MSIELLGGKLQKAVQTSKTSKFEKAVQTSKTPTESLGGKFQKASQTNKPSIEPLRENLLIAVQTNHSPIEIEPPTRLREDTSIYWAVKTSNTPIKLSVQKNESSKTVRTNETSIDLLNHFEMCSKGKSSKTVRTNKTSIGHLRRNLQKALQIKGS